MTKFVSATYHVNIQVAEFIADDGRHCLRAGGTLPWRINNCGDLSSPVNSHGEPNPKFTKYFIGFAKVPNSAGLEPYHFFIFPDYDTGRAQLLASLKRKYADKNIIDFAKKYAPSSTKDNDPAKYANEVADEAGITVDTKVGILTDAQLDVFINAIQKEEGYNNSAETQREVWIPVSTVIATDGARPLADEEIVLRVNGKDTVVKSNSVGQMPPIVHDKSAVEIFHKAPDDQLKSVGTISGDKGSAYSFIKNLATWGGHSAPDKTSPSVACKPRPMSYVVQPNDSLSKIATRFKTTVDKLKADNQLKSDLIFPGEKLGIFGTVSSLLHKARPYKTASVLVSPSNTSSSPDSEASAKAKVLLAKDQSLPARSQAGDGKPLAILNVDQKRVPWMAFAISEAKRWKGMQEGELEKQRNYHTLMHDGIKTMVNTPGAWCAAFVNWCLSQAGYPLDSPAWIARARGVYTHGDRDKAGHFVQNPLYIEIAKPIYGAIVVVCTAKGDQGTHATLVYAKEDANTLVLLGGNQHDRIMFAPFSLKTKQEYLRFFVPASYVKQAEQDDAKDDLPKGSAIQLNKDFEIDVSDIAPRAKNKTR